jgi:hypothetical protein
MSTSNQQFSYYRWRLLIAKHWSEHGRRYGLSLLAIGGLIATWEAFIIGIDQYAPLDPNMQFATYMVGLWFIGCLYASTLFSDLGSKKQALPWLSLPASHLEKLLCAILFGVVGFFIAYTLIFYIVDIPMVHWANNILRRHPRTWPGSTNPIPPSLVYNFLTASGAPVPEKGFHLFTAAYFAVQSAFVLGSVYFSRFPFFKTVVVVLLFMFGIVLFQRFMIHPILPEGWQNEIFRWTTRPDELEKPIQEVRLSQPLEKVITLLVQFAIPPFFWLATWYRLKEKEV